MIDYEEDVSLQRTPEWYQARCGRATASRIADVIGKLKGGGWAAPRAKYMNQIVAERLSGKPQDMRKVRSMEERSDLEPEARAAYSFYTDYAVDLVGFIPHPSIEYAGCSPDGLVRSDGQVEIKVLDAANHIKLHEGDTSPVLDYAAQMAFQLACTGRKWCDFVAYCPIMPEELKLFIQRIPRDEEVIRLIETEVRSFLAEVESRLAPLYAKTNGGF